MRSDINENIEIIEKKTRAFTLIEMLLVLLIISLLLILIIPNIAKQTSHIQSTGCDAQVKMVNSQIEAYALKHNRNPSNIDDLVSDGFIKKDKKHVNPVRQLVLQMEKQLPIKNIKAFSLVEMIFYFIYYQLLVDNNFMVTKPVRHSAN